MKKLLRRNTYLKKKAVASSLKVRPFSHISMPKRKTVTNSKKETAPSAPKKSKIEEETSSYFQNDTAASESDKSIDNSRPSLSEIGPVNNGRLPFSFYDISCEELAMSLLGQKLVHVVDKKRLTGVIVESEAYLGPIDKGAHSYEGKRSAKNEAMFMPPGTAYVYNIYGMYCCMNISAKGDGAAVLLRALEPVENLEEMDKYRSKGKASLMKNEGRGLCNGPSKLCQALNIKKDAINGVDLCSTPDIWVEKGEEIDPSKIVKCKRINIDYAGDWKNKPLRFYILGNKFNSVKDKEAESNMAA